MSTIDTLENLAPAKRNTFGSDLAARLRRIEPGLVADLVLWNGDPLELTTTAEQVWMRGQAMPMRSRQTELRDRYLQAPGALPRAYQH